MDDQKIGGWSQADLRRFIVNSINTDPGAFPKKAPNAFMDSDISYAAALSGSKLNWNRGTTPPLAPVDGTLWCYTGSGFDWLFVFDSSETTYQWKYIGGAALVSQALAAETQSLGNGGWVQPYTANPALNLPRAGDYELRATASMVPAAAAATWAIGLQIAGVNPPAIDQAFVAGTYSPVTSARSSPSMDGVLQGAASGTGIVMIYWQNGGVQNFARSNASLVVTPVRIA